MIVCSCSAISDTDIEQALVEILSEPGAPLPTPGVVYRHLEKRMVCCGCAPLAVSTIYQKIDELAEQGVVCPYACACAQGRLLKCASDTPALQLIERTSVRRRRTEKSIAAAPAVLVAAESAGPAPVIYDVAAVALDRAAARSARNFCPSGVTLTAILPPSTRSRIR